MTQMNSNVTNRTEKKSLLSEMAQNPGTTAGGWSVYFRRL